MRVEILEEKEKILIANIDGVTEFVRKNDYLILKHRQFDSNRIIYKFPNGDKIEETYNYGIFNCYRGDRRVQISDAISIARTIIHEDHDAFVRIFEEWYDAVAQDDFIDLFVESSGGRVRYDDAKYVVDEIFAIDKHGNAFYEKKKHWKHVCIVPENMGVNPTVFVPGRGFMTLNAVTVSIVAKIHFLLNPNGNDGVFMKQLPEELKEFVRQKDKIS